MRKSLGEVKIVSFVWISSIYISFYELRVGQLPNIYLENVMILHDITNANVTKNLVSVHKLKKPNIVYMFFNEL